MQEAAFQPQGQTFLITGAPVQVTVLSAQAPTSYRIRNVSTTNAYVLWSPALPSGQVPGNLTTVPPTAGAPVTNTLGMVASSVEVFRLPANAWFMANASGTFEVTAGEGV